MKIFVNDTVYSNEIMALLKAFYPFDAIEEGNIEQSTYIVRIADDQVKVAYFVDGKEVMVQVLPDTLMSEINGLEGRDRIILTKRLLKGVVYDLTSAVTGQSLSWGILTGIRPTKLAFKLYNESGSYEEVKDRLLETYRVSPEKADLLIEVIKTEEPFLEVGEGDHSIYIGIPFCPSKCSYCTFPSYQKDKWPEAFCRYTDTLIRELENSHERFKECTSLYIGGGTPTSLEEEDFDRLLAKVRQLLGARKVEFTVEAGRPDSITKAKLISMKAHGVTRISINPQTMQDRTLERIGRSHGSREIVDCFNLARDLGFDHINMDLILGLPDENTKDVKDTMTQVLALGPESITVHTLAFKRGSKLTDSRQEVLLKADKEIHASLALVQEMMAQSGYRPYYLYRQKQMVGQYENVGYCKPGHESVYNIRIMEEVEDIVAFGAGAISKRLRQGKIKRLDQPKDVKTYLAKVDRILEKKNSFFTE